MQYESVTGAEKHVLLSFDNILKFLLIFFQDLSDLLDVYC